MNQKIVVEQVLGNFPEKKFRAGAVSATVWRNKSQKGEGEYNTVSLERSYKDKEGQWQATNSLRTNDLPKAVMALQKAYEHIVLNEQDLFRGEA
ncbi:MAG TPA: hypothetical protein VJA23_04900 [Candidatus Nanoarchaeia archaeon]|nr:hypothetical protein [Candidatus Nanoarchaeia archaeon]